MPGIRSFIATAMAGAALFGAAGAHAAVLYDQTDSPGPSSDFAPSNDFAADFGADDWTADDFTVPAGQSWTIDHVDVTGTDQGTPPDSANVFIWADAGGAPGAEAFHQLNIPGGGTGPNFSLPVSGAPSLAAGTYWLSVEQFGATDGIYWSWGTRTALAGHPAMYKIDEPGPCGDWTVRSECYGDNPDQIFRLSGTASAVAAPVSPPAKHKRKCKKHRRKHKRSAQSAKKKKCKHKKKKR
jgi:hypothetical protein